MSSDSKRHEIRHARTTPVLNVAAQPIDWSKEKTNWRHLTRLDLPGVTPGVVDLVLGADVFHLIVPREVVEGPAGSPSAVRTLLGWTVTGQAPGRSMYETHELNCVRATLAATAAARDQRRQSSRRRCRLPLPPPRTRPRWRTESLASRQRWHTERPRPHRPSGGLRRSQGWSVRRPDFSAHRRPSRPYRPPAGDLVTGQGSGRIRTGLQRVMGRPPPADIATNRW